MAEILKQDVKLHLASVARQIEGATNMETFTKMKEILNRTFGEANNQIVKPSLENLERYIEEQLPNVKSQLLAVNGPTVERWLKDAYYLNYNIYVWFPETTIKNSKGATQVIKDLYVRIPVRPNGAFTGIMNGIVTSYTKAQYLSGYMHSHLRRFGSEGPKDERFCLGSGEITMVLSVLSHKFDEINFQLFCFHLKNYVAWESLEGTPYISMDNVASREGIPINKRVRTEEAIAIANALVDKIFTKNEQGEIYTLIKCSITKTGILVEPTEKLEELLAKIITELCPWSIGIFMFRSPNQLLAYKNGTGEYYGTDAASSGRINVPNRTAVHFKGNPVKFKLVDTDQQTKKTLYANPIITRAFCEQLSRKFTNAALALERNSWFKDTTDDINKTTNANSVVM